MYVFQEVEKNKMPLFEIDEFLKEPSIDQLGASHEADLFEIASHFGCSRPSTPVKTRLKELMIDLLVEFRF